MPLITLDFETYFDADYTLSKMTTEAYIRDPRFQAHCVGLKFNDQPALAVQGGLSITDPAKQRVFESSSILCHHAHFDGLIMSHWYGLKPAFWFDTLSMARLVYPYAKSHSLGALAKQFGLMEKSVPYQEFKGKRELEHDLMQKLLAGCAHDVDLTYAIFKKLLPYIPRGELRIIDLTIRMFTEPALRLDRHMLQTHLDKLTEEKEDTLDRLGVAREELNSNEKFAEMLRALGVEPPMKLSKTTGSETYALAKTDMGFRSLLEHDNQDVSELAHARLGIKSNIIETRSQRMLDMDARGAMCVYLKYCGAHTTRWSGGDKMNWQNFKRKSVLRESVLAPPGYVIGVADSSQIECRLLNWLAGEQRVLQAFREGRDLYSELATQFYGRPITKADKEERGVGKQLELSCGYGAGAETIKITARNGTYGPPVYMSDADAENARNLYRTTHPHVVQLWKAAGDILGFMSGGLGELDWGPMKVINRHIQGPNGTYLDYTPLKYTGRDYAMVTHKGSVRMYGAKLVENVVQWLARIVLSEAMLKIADRYRIVTCTHDEIVFLMPESEAERGLDWALHVMRNPPEWCRDVPLDAEGGYDVRYSK